MRTILSFVLPLQLASTMLAGSGGSFTENKGQWPGHVLFRAQFDRHAVFVEHNAWTVTVRSADGGGTVHHQPASDGSQMRHHAYRVQFVGASGPAPDGSQPIAGV